MITDLPIHIYIIFFISVVYLLIMFYYATNKNLKFISGIVLWGIIHSILAISGYYKNTETIPPRLLLLVFPLIPFVIFSIFSKNIKNWLSTFNLKWLTYLHTVRIPVEIVLFLLFLEGYVPQLMTFEGRNFDILTGISAPIVAFIAFGSNKINKPLLWIWNGFSLILLINILIHAVLSTPTILQQFAFEQPNVAMTKFPFLLLPAIIVPLVLISNIAGFIILKRQS